MPPGRLVDSRALHAVAPGASDQARVFHMGVAGVSVGGPWVIPGQVSQKSPAKKRTNNGNRGGWSCGWRHLFSGAVGHYSRNLLRDPGAAVQKRRFQLCFVRGVRPSFEKLNYVALNS